MFSHTSTANRGLPFLHLVNVQGRLQVARFGRRGKLIAANNWRRHYVFRAAVFLPLRTCLAFLEPLSSSDEVGRENLVTKIPLCGTISVAGARAASARFTQTDSLVRSRSASRRMRSFISVATREFRQCVLPMAKVCPVGRREAPLPPETEKISRFNRVFIA